MKYKHSIARITALICAAGCVIAAPRWSVPYDPNLRTQIEQAIRTSEQDGDSTRALREYRRYLELFPNEPLVRAPIYLAMSEAAERAGDTVHAAEYRESALAIDAKLPDKIRASGGPSTRGDKADKWAAILGVAAQTMATVQQQRQNYAAQQQQRMTQQMQDMQLRAQYQAARAQYAYPPAPVGAPGYAPPPAGYQQMPAYDPAAYGQMAAQPQAYAPAPGAYQQMPNAVPPNTIPQGSAMPQAMQPMPVQNPAGYAQPMLVAAQQVPMPQAPGGPYSAAVQPMQGQPMPMPQGGGGPFSGGIQQAPPPNPYAMPVSYAAPATRGASSGPIKVVYDRSVAGSKAWFEDACGALLQVDGANLTATSGCGDAPLLIPTADISEVRMNVAVGRNAGVFHIATKKGLYLSLATEGGSPDESRAIVDSLKKQLNLE